MALDITQIKEMQSEIQIRNSQLASIFRSAPVGIYHASPERVIIKVNKKLCEMLGYSEEELVGRSVSMLYPSEIEYETVGVGKRDLYSTKEVQKLETKCVGKKGNVMDVLLTLTLLDKDNSELGYIVTAEDITETKRIREQREGLNRLYLELGPDVIENMELILKTAEEIMGCDLVTFQLLIGDRLTVFSSLPGEEGLMTIPSKESTLCYEFIRRNAREPMSISDVPESEIASCDPIIQRFDFRSCLLFPVIVDGEVGGCLAAYRNNPHGWARDEIEIMGMLAQAISSEYARLLREESLRNFIDLASHEIRHPLTVIKGYTASLQNLWQRLSEDDREEMLKTIVKGVDRLTHLSEELLEVSRIESGKLPLKPQESNLFDIGQTAVQEMKARGFKHEFNVNIPPKTKVMVDPHRILEVLIILLENAAYFSPEKTEILVETESHPGEIRVSVLDRGVGIPDDKRNRVFERFYQIEEPLHHSSPGLGLGLYVARDIIEAHGGNIWNEPRGGGGTIFSFSLPHRSQHKEAQG